ncbi:unnamed protein product [Eruca vesicaria subsp. sativa]|uniref:DC1 domain-containing protein n=1 Tax=Eruca vesicaria subsp. sativa TaxID=29727 RepID=A0ABC8L734_ERUVS|nr:unnamed protein product [Eruca vesicaria subsp. sativa]
MNMYGCLLCNFFIHKNCIYLPKVIKLTCHSHRLFHTFQVLVNKKSCQICNQPLVYEYGGYICTHKSCDYKLHSYCATGKEVWDGTDVEQQPEEVSTSEDVALLSLVDIDSKTSRHFSHQHNLMRLCINDEVEDGGICQACILPIEFGSFFGCKECDFALHNTCAKLPRKMEHTFHRHPLNLEVNLMNIREGFFYCSKCVRASCGFVYRCYERHCEFKMDARCASISDPLYNRAHEHPLHLTDSGARCNQCDFTLKPERATLPVLVKHKYDTHPLTLGFFESIRWSGLRCIICEVKIEDGYSYSMGHNPDLYGCTECKTIMCVECAIGKYPYLKPDVTIKVNGSEFDTASNFSLSRPICHACQDICQDKLHKRNRRRPTALGPVSPLGGNTNAIESHNGNNERSKVIF